MTNQELRIERDMLDGNISRIMVTDDLTELRSMYTFARDRLENIYNAREEILSVIDKYNKEERSE